MQWLRNAAYILIVILGGGFLLLAGKDLLFPFLFAIFFSFLLMPLESKIFKRVPYKVVSITLSVLFVLGVIGGIRAKADDGHTEVCGAHPDVEKKFTDDAEHVVL